MRLTLSSRRLAWALAAFTPFAPSLFGASDSPQEQIAQLQAALAAQQKQLESLQHMIERQQKLIDDAVGSLKTSPAPVSLGTVASLAPMVPVRPLAAMALAQKTASTNPCEAPPDANAVPPYLRVGATCIMPVGFMDLTGVWRDKAPGSSLGSNFGGVPFNNVAAGHLSEFRFTPQNSRLGFRAEGDWKGTHFIGYNEFDFLGTSGSNTIGVTNGAFVPRLRLFWIDVRKDKWEFLGGQSWSMLTPNRKGISALPGDLFYSQVVDVNYMAGLTWTRQPGVRILYHPNSAVTMGISAENPNQYGGGSAGGPQIVAPAALTGLLGSQVDNGTAGYLSTPNVAPDFIAKIAFDPSSKFHAEVAGIERTFKTYNILNNLHSTKIGGGIQAGANFELVKNFRLITTNYWSDGGGRYLFGQAPDVIIRSDGSISPIHAGGTVDGAEWTIRNTLLYAYYGGIYIGRNTALDANGTTRVGYGFTGSANSQNRAINEVTFGFNQTMWKNPRYGAVNVMGQYEWLQRNPWFVALAAPKATHDNTIYINLRYTLPGSMPNF